jgi:hypothetical protein
VLADGRASSEIANQALQAAQESNSTWTRDWQDVQASTASLKEDLDDARVSATAAN